MEETTLNEATVTILYKTADGKQICVEVSTSVKELLEQSNRQIRSQRRQDRRHLDFVDFIADIADAAMIYPETDPANLLISKESYERLYEAIHNLSEVQRRRLLLHFTDDLTHTRIAKLEGINRATVSRSIARALAQLKKELSE